jgi:hypothetical protein
MGMDGRATIPRVDEGQLHSAGGFLHGADGMSILTSGFLASQTPFHSLDYRYPGGADMGRITAH